MSLLLMNYARQGVRAASGIEALWLGNLPAGLDFFGETYFDNELNDTLGGTNNNLKIAGAQAGVSVGAPRTDRIRLMPSAPFGPEVYSYTYPEGHNATGSGYAGGAGLPLWNSVTTSSYSSGATSIAYSGALANDKMYAGEVVSLVGSAPCVLAADASADGSGVGTLTLESPGLTGSVASGAAMVARDGAQYNTGSVIVSAKRYYVCFAVWFSPNYVLHQGGEKLFYPTTGTTAAVSTACAVNIDTPQNGDNSSWMEYDDMWVSVAPQTTGVGPQRVWSATTVNAFDGRPTVKKGEWNLFECYLQCNTADNLADGEAKVWLNGTLVIDTNICLAKVADPIVRSLRIDSTRGGGASSIGAPVGGQTRAFSRLAHYRSTTL